MGGKTNGVLLRLAEQEFDVFLTADQKLPNQQNLATFHIAVVVFAAVSKRLRDLEPPRCFGEPFYGGAST